MHLVSERNGGTTLKVGLSGCSNGQSPQCEKQIDELCKFLETIGVVAMKSPHMITKIDEYSGTDAERAEDLMRFYKDDEIEAIYDVTGGDLANGVLKYLDFEIIKNSSKSFWGYSDLTTIINAIYTKTGKTSVLYQVKNLVWSKAKLQQKRFAEYSSGKSNALFDITYDFLQGSSMEGVVVGGNLRCFLKLAGTEYWPDLNGKILLLESFGGESGGVATLFNQLDLMGVFDQINGVLLGTFTSYEKAKLQLSIFDLLKMHISEDLPVAQTMEIGHGNDAKAIRIGEFARFSVRKEGTIEDEDS